MKTIAFIVCFLLSVCFALIQAQTTNFDFEQTAPGTYTNANAVSGWTIESQTYTTQVGGSPVCTIATGWNPGASEFSVISTPFIPVNYSVVGVLGHSPLGGTHVVQLNDTNTNSSVTRLTRNYFVGAPNTSISFAFAGYWEDGGGGHYCCDSPGMSVFLRDTLGHVIYCKYISLVSGGGCFTGGTTFTISSANFAAWTNWQVRTFDLSPYYNSKIVIELVSKDCNDGNHVGLSYFDCTIKTNPTPVLFCPGSNQAIISGPPDQYIYQWYLQSWPIPGSTQSVFTINNPVAGNSYTLVYGPCYDTLVYTLAHSSVGISNINVLPTCQGVGAGAATVTANGSNVGYTYSWTNSTNSVISTGSVVTGLSPGIYSVSVSATGNSSCGVAGNTVAINSTTVQRLNVIGRPFCNSTVYFNINSGSNFQWYNTAGAISASLGGTSSSYSASGVTNSSIYFTSYNNSQGCKDSTIYYLTATNPGSISVISNPTVCMNTNTATVVLSLTPVPGAPTGSISFLAQSFTTVTPSYSLAQGPGISNTFTLTNLSANTSYSVTSFDGFCQSQKTFSVSTLNFGYYIGLNGSPTICPQSTRNMQVLGLGMPSQYNQYGFQISPSTYLQGSPTGSNVLISPPVLPPGTYTTVTYTIVVTPTTLNCPLAATQVITVINPNTPTITNIPPLCSNSPQYIITSLPTTGTYTGQGVSNNGIIFPHLAGTGANTFTFYSTVSNCASSVTATYTVNPSPIISIVGAASLCSGQTTSITASGAPSFTWSDGSVGALLSTIPINNTTYTVTGINPSTNCYTKKNFPVSVVLPPVITLTGDTSLCKGDSTIITASGAAYYNWGGSFGPTLSIAPEVSSTYTLTYQDANHDCAFKKSFTVSVYECTGLKEESRDENVFSIYPNPTTGKIILKRNISLSIQIFDQHGIQIHSDHFEEGKSELDISSFAAGVYFLRLEYNNASEVIKLLKSD